MNFILAQSLTIFRSTKEIEGCFGMAAVDCCDLRHWAPAIWAWHNWFISGSCHSGAGGFSHGQTARLPGHHGSPSCSPWNAEISLISISRPPSLSAFPPRAGLIYALIVVLLPSGVCRKWKCCSSLPLVSFSCAKLRSSRALEKTLWLLLEYTTSSGVFGMGFESLFFPSARPHNPTYLSLRHVMY